MKLINQRSLVLKALMMTAVIGGAAPVLAQSREQKTKGMDGQSTKLTPALAQRAGTLIDGYASKLTETFKDLHQHPELGFKETRTSGILASELKRLGFQVKTGIAKTGVVGILHNGLGPTVMYRADMDANTMKEETGLAYASTVRVMKDDGTEAPVGHMCGHDAHVTWMLGMARAMVAMKSAWSGTIILIGQPAEELIEGASAMVKDGLYTRHGTPKPDYLLGIHTAPAPVGVIASTPGSILAGTNQLDILFKGEGGHGSMPQTTKDPIIMATYAVTMYQAIVSRTITPTETGVLTVGSIQAGYDNNIIPVEALVRANLRWYEPKVRDGMIAGIKSISEGVARIYGMPENRLPVITMKGNSPPLVNDKALSNRIAVALKPYFGEKQIVTEMPPGTGSEDVQLLKGDYQDVPMDYMFVGIADPAVFAAAAQEGKLPFTSHAPNFKVDLAAIPVGTKAATLSMLELMAK